MKRVTAAVLVSFLLASGIAAAAEYEPDASDRTKLGEFAPSSPPFPAPTISLIDSSGHSVELADLKGKLVVVNLWATWCEPCLREMPSLERLQSRLGERIAVLAVSEDRGGNKTVEPFIAKLGLKSVKVYVDAKSEVGRAFGARGLPSSFLIGRDGKVLGRVEGAAEWDSPKILGVLEPLLSGDGVVKASSR
ncbi:MAG TPA: TlpA disulfide reductase family protein [Stellaceae bacterium]|jgi:thiol-disulfide isomerase/thioredoxin|nr:TlpA disulfide reductase family protein [Stellaceae bacterium]